MVDVTPHIINVLPQINDVRQHIAIAIARIASVTRYIMSGIGHIIGRLLMQLG